MSTDILKGLNYLINTDQKNLMDFFKLSSKNRKFNRYFQSLFILYRNKNYCITVIDDCLVIFKNKVIMANHVFYLALAPMSKSGNISDEKKVLEKLLDLGIKVRLTEEEVVLYDIDSTIFSFNNPAESGEYIYNSMFKDLSNVDRKTRWYINDVLKNKNVHYISTSNPNQEMINEVRELYSSWSKCKKLKIPYVFEKNNLYTNLIYNIIYEKNTAVGFSCVEKTGEGKYLLLNRLFDYDKINEIKDLTRYMHYVDILNSGSVNSIYNIGIAGVAKGLHVAKVKLHPILIQEIREYFNPENKFISSKSYTMLKEILVRNNTKQESIFYRGGDQ